MRHPYQNSNKRKSKLHTSSVRDIDNASCKLPNHDDFADMATEEHSKLALAHGTTGLKNVIRSTPNHEVCDNSAQTLGSQSHAMPGIAAPNETCFAPSLRDPDYGQPENIRQQRTCGPVDAQSEVIEPYASKIATPQQISRSRGVMIEPLPDPFTSHCCCQMFFEFGGNFQDCQELYRLFLAQSNDKARVGYAIALLLYAHTRPRGASSVELQRALREAIEYYLPLCTQVDIKNKPANAIIHALLEVVKDVVGDEILVENKFGTNITLMRHSNHMSSVTSKISAQSRPWSPLVSKTRLIATPHCFFSSDCFRR